MSEQAHVAGAAAHHGHDSHPDSYYVKIWGVLMVLLVVSVLGPELKIQVVTLITAFGIAIVKAYLVVKNFMHIGVERKWVAYLLVTMVLLMLVMVGGVGPDVLRHKGHRWENVAAQRAVERGQKEAGEHGHGAEHGEPHQAPAEHH